MGGDEMDGRTADGGAATGPSGPFFRWVRVLDDGLYRVEQAFVALALSLITLMVFLDVVHRRVTAPDSKMGEVLGRLAFVEDAETQAWIDGTLATPIGTVLSILLLAFGFNTAKRLSARNGRPWDGFLANRAAPWVFAVLAVLGCWAFAWALEHIASSTVYAVIFLAGGLAYTVDAFRKSHVVAGVGGLIATALLVWFAVSTLPEGYFWSKKVSLMLLLWVGFLGASICAHEGKHIRIEALGRLVPEGVRRYVSATGFLITAAFCAFLAALGFYLVFKPTPSDNPDDLEMIVLFGTRYVFHYSGEVGQGGVVEGTEIPAWIAVVAIPFAFGLTMIRYLGATVSALLGGTYGAQAPDEGMEEAAEMAASQAPPSSLDEGEVAS